MLDKKVQIIFQFSFSFLLACMCLTRLSWRLSGSICMKWDILISLNKQLWSICYVKVTNTKLLLKWPFSSQSKTTTTKINCRLSNLQSWHSWKKKKKTGSWILKLVSSEVFWRFFTHRREFPLRNFWKTDSGPGCSRQSGRADFTVEGRGAGEVAPEKRYLWLRIKRKCIFLFYKLFIEMK